jgi:uncharacterized protein (TIGR02147 family)
MEEIVDYRQILKHELEARCDQNPRYSLRAFARDLDLAPSRLSELLSGKQGLSRAAAQRICAALNFSKEETDRFCDLVDSLHARSEADRVAASARLRKYEKVSKVYQLQEDAFRVISEWYHLGILELMQLKDFRDDSRWLASKLGISQVQVELAIERLLRLRLLAKENDRLVPAKEQGNVPDDIPSASIKKFHRQILEKASEALYMQGKDQREFGAVVIAVNKSQLAELKADMRKFQHEICTKASEAPDKDGLYCLAIQFFDMVRG